MPTPAIDIRNLVRRYGRTDAINGLSKTTQNSDLQTHAAANGKANMVDVVTAVAESEVAIDTLVSVRDKVISAYEEIMKMPI